MGGAVFPPCYLTWGQTMVEVMKIMATSFKRSHAHTATLSAPDPAARHHWPTPPLETPGHPRASLGQSLVGSLLLSPGSWCTQGFACALQESVPPVLCKFWWLCGGVDGDLLQEGLCHIQAMFLKIFNLILSLLVSPWKQRSNHYYYCSHNFHFDLGFNVVIMYSLWCSWVINMPHCWVTTNFGKWETYFDFKISC